MRGLIAFHQAQTIPTDTQQVKLKQQYDMYNYIDDVPQSIQDMCDIIAGEQPFVDPDPKKHDALCDGVLQEPDLPF